MKKDLSLPSDSTIYFLSSNCAYDRVSSLLARWGNDRDGQFLLATTRFFFSFALPIVFAHSKPHTHTHTHWEIAPASGADSGRFSFPQRSPESGQSFPISPVLGTLGFMFAFFSNQPRLVPVCDFLTPLFPSCHGWHVTRVDPGGIVSQRTRVEGGNI